MYIPLNFRVIQSHRNKRKRYRKNLRCTHQNIVPFKKILHLRNLLSLVTRAKAFVQCTYRVPEKIKFSRKVANSLPCAHIIPTYTRNEISVSAATFIILFVTHTPWSYIMTTLKGGAVRTFSKYPFLKQSEVLSVVPAIGQNVTRDTSWENAVPYSDVPGPRPMPFLGNSWRFLPYIGRFYEFFYFSKYMDYFDF